MRAMPLVYEKVSAMRKKIKIGIMHQSAGLVIPFQPSMWDDNQISMALNHATETFRQKVKEKYSSVEVQKNLLSRLESLFAKLNFNTLRKSLAILLSPEGEKAIYLDFIVKPVAWISKSISLLDFTGSIREDPEFFILLMLKNKAVLYNYSNNHLNTVYTQDQITVTGDLHKYTSAVIELLNSNNLKPVFITGDEDQVNSFYSGARLPETFFKKLYVADLTETMIHSMAAEITRQWDYWKARVLAHRIIFAQKENSLIYNINATFQALQNGANGLLLIDKRLKRRLVKSSIADFVLDLPKGIMAQLENFFIRGNRIEITKAGLLRNFGSIILLQDKMSMLSSASSLQIYSKTTGVYGLY